MAGTIWAAFFTLMLVTGNLFLVAPAVASEAEAPKGQYLGAKIATHPAWFKESFLDFSEDIEEAAEQGKRLVLYFWQVGCPYCNQLWEHNMSVDGIEEQFKSGFDVVAINMWGDQEVVTVAGRQFTEKQLARALDVDFTPTLLFYDEQKQAILRLNGYLPPERFSLALEFGAGGGEPGQSFSEYVLARTSGASQLARSQDFFQPASEALFDRSRKPGARPLAVLFESPDCASCENFHDVTLAHEDTRALLAQMDVVQLNISSDDPVTLPNGESKSPAEWASELELAYFPSIAFFDENGEQVALMNAYFRNFHTQSVFAYVLEKAYLEQPSFQRYISARAEHLNEQGVDVDIWAE